MTRPALLFLFFLSFTFRLTAQPHKYEAGFQADNDSFLGQRSDRYYTNGLFLNFRQALKIADADSAKLKNKVLGLEIGQKIYNPQSGFAPAPQYIDRPFAGYLYGGASLNLLYRNESNLKLTVQAGIIGPGALGYDIQHFIHDTFGFYQLAGWQYQVHDGFQLNLSAEYNRLLARAAAADLTFTGNAALGNGFSGAGAGLILRLGNFNQLYNSVSTQSTVSQSDLKPLHHHELFAYYKPVLNYVAYDATIQGSLFYSYTPATEVLRTKAPVVLNNQVGGAYASNRWVFDINIVFQTKNTKEMRLSEQWGSVAVLYRFN